MPETTPPVSPNRAKIDGKEQDLTDYVKDMLSEMENDFEQVGNSILSRMHRMGRKMDHLERSIGDLMNDAGLDGRKHNGLSSSSSSSSPPSMEEQEDGQNNQNSATTTVTSSPHESTTHKPTVL